jgi:CBS domain-containing protein
MTVTAADLMTTPAITVDPNASIGQVAELLVDQKISALPVCKPDGSLAGIISELDVMRPFREAMRRKRDRWLGLIAEGEALSPDFLEYLKTDTKLASDLMARHVVTASPAATLPELAELMVEHGVKRIPIVEGGRLVGIVSRSDLLRAISKSPEQAL